MAPYLSARQDACMPEACIDLTSSQRQARQRTELDRSDQWQGEASALLLGSELSGSDRLLAYEVGTRADGV